MNIKQIRVWLEGTQMSLIQKATIMEAVFFFLGVFTSLALRTPFGFVIVVLLFVAVLPPLWWFSKPVWLYLKEKS